MTKCPCPTVRALPGQGTYSVKPEKFMARAGLFGYLSHSSHYLSKLTEFSKKKKKKSKLLPTDLFELIWDGRVFVCLCITFLLWLKRDDCKLSSLKQYKAIFSWFCSSEVQVQCDLTGPSGRAHKANASMAASMCSYLEILWKNSLLMKVVSGIQFRADVN